MYLVIELFFSTAITHLCRQWRASASPKPDGPTVSHSRRGGSRGCWLSVRPAACGANADTSGHGRSECQRRDTQFALYTVPLESEAFGCVPLQRGLLYRLYEREAL